MKPDAFILAGGASRRMGIDKATLRLADGSAMLERVRSALIPVSRSIRLVRRRNQAGVAHMSSDLGVVYDLGGEQPHPLWGIEAALRSCSTDFALIVACDLPALPTLFLQSLIAQACPHGVVASCGGRVHPLVGLYPKRLTDAALQGAREEISMRAFSEACRRFEGRPEWFRNVNAPTDLRD